MIGWWTWCPSPVTLNVGLPVGSPLLRRGPPTCALPVKKREPSGPLTDLRCPLWPPKENPSVQPSLPRRLSCPYPFLPRPPRPQTLGTRTPDWPLAVLPHDQAKMTIELTLQELQLLVEALEMRELWGVGYPLADRLRALLKRAGHPYKG